MRLKSNYYEIIRNFGNSFLMICCLSFVVSRSVLDTEYRD
jgi:hypothetical protein